MVVSVVQIGNSRGIRFPKSVLDKFLVKDKMNMDITDEGILITPIKNAPREDWAESFRAMHKNNEDKLESVPESEDFEWEW